MNLCKCKSCWCKFFELNLCKNLSRVGGNLKWKRLGIVLGCVVYGQTRIISGVIYFILPLYLSIIDIFYCLKSSSFLKDFEIRKSHSHPLPYSVWNIIDLFARTWKLSNQMKLMMIRFQINVWLEIL